MSRPQPDPTLVSPQALRGWRLPEPTGGKESRGSILGVGASTETLGAVLLGAEAALRSGAGKLQVVVPAKVAPHVLGDLVRGRPHAVGTPDARREGQYLPDPRPRERRDGQGPRLEV